MSIKNVLHNTNDLRSSSLANITISTRVHAQGIQKIRRKKITWTMGYFFYQNIWL